MSAFVSVDSIAPVQASFSYSPESAYEVALTPEVEEMLRANAVAAVGVSGGKDSVACALAVARHLDAIRHGGPRLLIHAHLGDDIEWQDSLKSCQRLATHLGWELLVVERAAGGLVTRWQTRWTNNVARYANLECVKLISPFSTPKMRFCTSEMKVAVVARELRRRFPVQPILNVTGVRRQESARRSQMPVSLPLKQAERKHARALTWNAIIDWRLEEVLSIAQEASLVRHEAYRVYGSSRVSCVYCIMSSHADLLAATQCTDNHEVYRIMVELEAVSTFSFQANRWLGDVAPHLLSDDLRRQLEIAKLQAKRRQAIEMAIPADLLYVKGWPTKMPTREQAELIATVRRDTSALLRIKAGYLTADLVLARYAELLAAAVKKNAAKRRTRLAA